MKNLVIIIILISSIFGGVAFTQTRFSIEPLSPNELPSSINFLGRPRTPLNTSFYSKSMWEYDGLRAGLGIDYSKNAVPLSELHNKINPSGKIIVYDASNTTIPSNFNRAQDKIVIDEKTIVINEAEKTIQIPIEYVGNTPTKFTNEEKRLIYEYVNESLSVSESTPSNVRVFFNNGDIDIKIDKSKFTNEFNLVEGLNLRSRSEKKESFQEIINALDEGQQARIVEKLDNILIKYPEASEFKPLKEKLESITFAADVNGRKNNIVVNYIEEQTEGFSVYDGFNPKKDYKTINKQEFVNDLFSGIDENVTVVYLDVNGLGDEKADAFIRSVRIQAKNQRPNIQVKILPKDLTMREIIFNGLVKGEKTTVSLIDDYSAIQTYNISTKGKLWEIGLGIKITPSILKSNAKKYLNYFFNVFGKSTKSKEWILSDAIYDTRKQMEKKYKDLKPEDYDNFIKDELGVINIVFFRQVEEPLNTFANGR